MWLYFKEDKHLAFRILVTTTVMMTVIRNAYLLSDVCIISNEVSSVASWKPKVDYQTVCPRNQDIFKNEGSGINNYAGHRYKLELPLRQLIKRMQRDLLTKLSLAFPWTFQVKNRRGEDPFIRSTSAHWIWLVIPLIELKFCTDVTHPQSLVWIVLKIKV